MKTILPHRLPARRRFRRIPLLLLALAAVSCATDSGRGSGAGAGETEAGERRTFRARQMLMGTIFDIQVVGASEERSAAALEAAFGEIARVEQPLSEWRESSEISEVNRRAGRSPVVIGPELYEVVARSLTISEWTGGAFDASFSGCGRLWSFGERLIPSAEDLARCLPGVDYRRIRLDEQRSSLFLPGGEMRIGIAGIGKGYGVDRAAAVLEEHGFGDYIVDGGGDIRLSGSNLGRPWKVGIRHPRRKDELYATLTLDGGAIVTSGDYERQFERNGVRYHHILDPSTGMPARRSIAVTVIAATAMDADALATGLFVMGPESGLELVERLEGVEALFFGPDGAVHRSSGFPRIDPLR